MSRWSLRLEQAEVSRLAWAFAISLAFHLLIYGSYHTGNKYHIWHHLHLPAWVHAPKFLTELIKPKQSLVPPRRREDTPLIFVNVSPAQATAEPPKEAKYYSDKNARAANPEGRIAVSVAIGADPGIALGGILPIPPDLDEMMFSGFLRREPVEMVPCETNELEVPANAEIVLEG